MSTQECSLEKDLGLCGFPISFFALYPTRKPLRRPLIQIYRKLQPTFVLKTFTLCSVGSVSNHGCVVCALKHTQLELTCPHIYSYDIDISKTCFYLYLPDAKVRLEKLREDAELRQKREHMKYMETLAADPSEEAAPLLKLTQQKKELALQGSTELIFKQDPGEERTPNNVPFFQSRKPVDPTTVLKGTESKKTLSSSEKGTPTADTQLHTKPLKDDQPVKCSSAKSSSSIQKKAELSPSEQARREHFSRLRQAGWIMDLDGKWYKDEDAEFDSDEDEPPPPP